ncbi:MAG TPA: DUF4926 domain-containing protein [Thermodesulfovibrionia bacterium]|nr:DUF4926 domain-containing protein [Thermodesulfovibrionia bacterium]
MPEIGDVIELITDIPNRNLRVGRQGTIVHCHNNDSYEIEFTDNTGRTLDFLALHSKQFIIVWQIKTKQWVSVAEQVSALIANLPDEEAKEVLDFARFLSLKFHHFTDYNKISA